jgi:perosamine synthetase
MNIPLTAPIFDEEMKNAAIYALQNDRFVMGESVQKFEEEFARFCGARFGVATSSGTSALALCLIALDIKGGEVLTSPASFVASANAILHAGGTPKFADISMLTYTVDPEGLRAAVKKQRTKALLPVHLYGHPASMDEIHDVASENGIALVEDACQAHGAVYNGMKVGAIGDVGCFSFYPSKNMTVGGDGGMVVTNDESIAEVVGSLRDSGRAKGSKYRHVKIGFTARMNSVQAAIGRVQLERLDDWNNRRRTIASQYDKLLSEAKVILPPREHGETKPVYHMYVIRSSRRDDLKKWLEAKGIECGIHYPAPIHLQPIYCEMFGYKGGEYPNAESLSKEALSIPMFPGLTEEQVEFVANSIREFSFQEKERS